MEQLLDVLCECCLRHFTAWWLHGHHMHVLGALVSDVDVQRAAFVKTLCEAHGVSPRAAGYLAHTHAYTHIERNRIIGVALLGGRSQCKTSRMISYWSQGHSRTLPRARLNI